MAIEKRNILDLTMAGGRAGLARNLTDFGIAFFEALEPTFRADPVGQRLDANSARDLFLRHLVEFHARSGFTLPLKEDVKAFGPFWLLLHAAFALTSDRIDPDVWQALDECRARRDEREKA